MSDDWTRDGKIDGICDGSELGARLGPPDGLAEGFLLGIEEGTKLELGLGVASPWIPE